MFDWLFMASYKGRVVDRFEKEDLIIDTASVNGGSLPFETGITWPSEYPGSEGWIIVAAYATKEEARAGHKEWVKRLTSLGLPGELIDCSNSALQQLANVLSGTVRVAGRKGVK